MLTVKLTVPQEGNAGKNAGILTLRHEVAVPHRRTPEPRIDMSLATWSVTVVAESYFMAAWNAWSRLRPPPRPCG